MHSYSWLLGCGGEERGRDQGPAAENWPTTGNRLQARVHVIVNALMAMEMVNGYNARHFFKLC